MLALISKSTHNLYCLESGEWWSPKQDIIFPNQKLQKDVRVEKKAIKCKNVL